jgi:beta-glucosidase
MAGLCLGTLQTVAANAINISDLAMVTDTYSKMKGKPVIVSVNMNNPMIFGEFEKDANAITVNFGTGSSHS